MDLQTFKRENSFRDLAAKLGYNLDGKVPCPKCGDKSSFHIHNNLTYKCFRPSCSLTQGDIFHFVQEMGLAKNFSEALNLITGNRFGMNTHARLKRRHSILSYALSLYKKELKQSPEAITYYQDRGYGNPHKEDVGYAPDQSYFLSENSEIPTRQLINENLITEDGNDLIRNRIVFPIRDHNNLIVHLHSRSLEADPPTKWLATKAPDDIKTNIHYAWRGVSSRAKEIYICEGISDGIVMKRVGLPVVAALSIMSNFDDMLFGFNNLERIVAVYDNDTFAYGSQNAGLYKSWEFVLPRLIDYQRNHPNITIECVMPPSMPGQKDVNDWLTNLGFNKNLFLKQVKKEKRSLMDFAFSYYMNRPDKHKEVLSLIKSCPDESRKQLAKDVLVKWVNQNYNEWTEYLLFVIDA